MTKQQAMILAGAAVVFGVVAAGLVWYLERFETERMFAQMRSYLAKYDAFRAYEADHDDG